MEASKTLARKKLSFLRKVEHEVYDYCILARRVQDPRRAQVAKSHRQCTEERVSLGDARRDHARRFETWRRSEVANAGWPVELRLPCLGEGGSLQKRSDHHRLDSFMRAIGEIGRVMLRRYVPLAAAGFARTIASSTRDAPDKLLLIELRLTHDRVNDTGLIETELDLTPYDVAHRRTDVRRNGAALGTPADIFTSVRLFASKTRGQVRELLIDGRISTGSRLRGAHISAGRRLDEPLVAATSKPFLPGVHGHSGGLFERKAETPSKKSGESAAFVYSFNSRSNAARKSP